MQRNNGCIYSFIPVECVEKREPVKHIESDANNNDTNMPNVWERAAEWETYTKSKIDDWSTDEEESSINETNYEKRTNHLLDKWVEYIDSGEGEITDISDVVDSGLLKRMVAQKLMMT